MILIVIIIIISIIITERRITKTEAVVLKTVTAVIITYISNSMENKETLTSTWKCWVNTQINLLLKVPWTTNLKPKIKNNNQKEKVYHLPRRIGARNWLICNVYNITLSNRETLQSDPNSKILRHAPQLNPHWTIIGLICQVCYSLRFSHVHWSYSDKTESISSMLMKIAPTLTWR